MRQHAITDERHQKLIEQNTEIASLAGGLAHEIKNPLSTLSLNLQLLAEDYSDPQTQKERRALQKIETLQTECKRLEAILNDFLRFARVTDLEFEPIDLNDVVREMIDFQTPHLEAGSILLRDNLHHSLPKVMIDEDFFKQALLNLLLNAQQAMPKGGELILKTHFDDRHVYLDVIDTGIGMSPDLLARVFKPFFSTQKGGSGLGLPTVKRIVEAHHGTLTVESEVGKGTAFTMRLDRADAPHEG